MSTSRQSHAASTQPSLSALHTLGQVRPHVTLAAANAALEPIVRQFAKQHPERVPDHWHLALEPIIWTFQEDTGRTLKLLLAGVVLLLIIGCGNCSILLLARGRTRQHELAIRTAIGASRWRIVRQLLVEAIVISCAGAVLVAGFNRLARLPMSLSPDSFPAESFIPHQRSHPCVLRHARAALWHPLRSCPGIASFAARSRTLPVGRPALWLLPASVAGAFSSPRKSRSLCF